MTTYLIAHTPRTGSNWLCEVLAQTGKLGIGHVDRAGLFVGLGDGLRHAYPGKVDEYFRDSTSPSGICGMKAGWEYLDLMGRYFPAGAVDNILSRYTHFIHLQRRDWVAQAVSWSIAEWSGVFTTVNQHKPGKKNPLDAPYNYDDIKAKLDQIAADNERWLTWFDEHNIRPLPLYYEEMQRDGMILTVQKVAKFLAYGGNINIKAEYTLRRQTNPLKAEFAQRFNEEYIAQRGWKMSHTEQGCPDCDMAKRRNRA